MSGNEAEISLVQRAVKRDSAAFATLYDKYVGRIYGYAYYLVHDQKDAEDITQEVFIKAWKAIDRYKDIGAPFVAWLTAITHNLAVNHNRYKSRKKHIPLEETEVLSTAVETNPETMAEVNLNKSYVRKAILKLKGEKQKIIMMRCIEGFSYREIAHLLNKSEGSVRVIQYRALSDLRRILMRGKDTI
ncbi:MAG: RNA polymerase sigma factor [Dehalococcoidales bacterium]